MDYAGKRIEKENVGNNVKAKIIVQCMDSLNNKVNSFIKIIKIISIESNFFVFIIEMLN